MSVYKPHGRMAGRAAMYVIIILLAISIGVFWNWDYIMSHMPQNATVNISPVAGIIPSDPMMQVVLIFGAAVVAIIILLAFFRA